MQKAVFLDRDDTIIANARVTAHLPYPGDLFDPALVELLPGAGAGLAALQRAGFALVVVTNQGAVARGNCTIEQVEATNARAAALLSDGFGVEVAAWLYCPYHPMGTVPEFTREHPWRKPQPGMILEGARQIGADLQHSWLIGDASRDVQAGIAAGIPASSCVLVGASADAQFPDCAAASAFIVETSA